MKLLTSAAREQGIPSQKDAVAVRVELKWVKASLRYFVAVLPKDYVMGIWTLASRVTCHVCPQVGPDHEHGRSIIA